MFTAALPDPERHAEFYAGVPTKRALAWVVDSVLTSLITAVIVVLTAFTALFFIPFVYMTVNLLYRWISISRHSATPGMRLMAIEFRRADGHRFDAGTALLHTAAFLISFAMVLPQVASAAFMLVTGRGQGLTDTLLGTVAINRPGRY
jgi:uncharacterized RDD family membrane protein YckC